MSRGNGTKEKRENTFMHTHAFMYISVYMHSGKGVPTLPPTLNEKDRGVKKTVNAAEQPTHTGSRAAADWLGCSHNKQLIGSLGLCKKRKNQTTGVSWQQQEQNTTPPLRRSGQSENTSGSNPTLYRFVLSSPAFPAKACG